MLAVSPPDISDPATRERLAYATKNRIGGSRIAAIVRAWVAIDSRCVVCAVPVGDAANMRPVFGHLVPSAHVSNERAAYTADNGALMHAGCNYAVADRVVTHLAYIPAYLGTFPSAPRRRTSNGPTAAQRHAADLATS